MLKYTIFKRVADMLYSSIFRDLLLKAIDDPDQEWDDDVMRFCDAFFNKDE